MTVATATQTLEERVEGWANDLCEALEENFKQEAIRSHERNIETGDAWSKEYHQNKIDAICLLYTSPSPRDKRQSRMAECG